VVGADAVRPDLCNLGPHHSRLRVLYWRLPASVRCCATVINIRRGCQGHPYHRYQNAISSARAGRTTVIAIATPGGLAAGARGGQTRLETEEGKLVAS